MSFDWKNVIKSLAPTLGAAIGGPVGLGAATILQGLLGTKDSQETTLAAAVANATPEQFLAIKNADQAFKLKMEELGFKKTIDIERIGMEDRSSARNLNGLTRDKTPAIGFYVISLGFFGMLAYMMKCPIPEANKAVIFTMIGSLGTAWLAAVYFFYGKNSEDLAKDRMLYNSSPVGTKE